MKKQLSFRERHSIVWLENGRIYKSQPKYNTDNEYYFLQTLADSGYVPQDVRQEDVELISMEYIPPQEVTDPGEFSSHYWPIIWMLEEKGIRHGDLTEYSVLVKDNTPIMIDFAESRWLSDSIPPKRPESDKELLHKAMERICPPL
jgi:RIO-like serine/threonine protein kinase